jgi:hypothetical protein
MDLNLSSFECLPKVQNVKKYRAVRAMNDTISQCFILDYRYFFICLVGEIGKNGLRLRLMPDHDPSEVMLNRN